MLEIMGHKSLKNAVCTLVSAALITTSALAASSTPSRTTTAKKTTTPKISESAAAKKKLAKRKSRARYYEHFYTSSFVDDNAAGDVTAGEDPIVRAAAVDALGNMNGTIVAINPDNGRILAMVNQKLALSEGAQPCSTFKVAVGLAALSEGIITKDTDVKLGRRTRVNLTQALAHSNNAYFE